MNCTSPICLLLVAEHGALPQDGNNVEPGTSLGAHVGSLTSSGSMPLGSSAPPDFSCARAAKAVHVDLRPADVMHEGVGNGERVATPIPEASM